MNIDECVSSLRRRIWRLHPSNTDMIMSCIISRKTPVEIRQYLLASDDQIQRLIVEAKSASLPSVHQFPLLPPPQPQHLIHPSVSSHGIQRQNTPIGQIGDFQSPFPGFIGLEEHFQSMSIPGDGLPSNYGNACQSVSGYSPSSFKEQTKPCHFHFSMGHCKKGENCPFSHGSEMNNVRQVRTLESLPLLEKEISELLLSLQPPRVPIESLSSIYIKRYGKPLKIKCSCMGGQQHDHSLASLLMMLCTTRVIERHGQCYIVPVGEAPKYLDGDFKLVMSPAGNYSNHIYITFHHRSTFTKEDVWNYFSQYGPVNDVQIPTREKRMFGYVSFLHSGTVKRILSERSPMKPHLICGDKVFVKAWKEKHELEKLAQKDAHSNSGAHMASVVNVIHEHHTVDNKTESSDVRSHLDEASTAQDSDDLGLPETLDDIY